MKKNKLMLFVVAIGLMSSCVPINPNWSPEQQAKVQSSNAQMVQGAGIGLLGAGAALFGAAQLNNSGGQYFHGGRYYGNRGYRHGHYYYY